VIYSGLLLDYPAIPKSSLVKQPESKSGTIHQPHRTVQCRVFKDAGAVAT
jgi:hypothetical protein